MTPDFEAVRNASQANGLGPRAHQDIPETSGERDTRGGEA